MDLPDCPPGAEGYEDSVTEVPKKPELEDSTCTKSNGVPDIWEAYAELTRRGPFDNLMKCKGYTKRMMFLPVSWYARRDSTRYGAEQEFQEHLNSLRIKCEDGSQRCMVERRGRDVSGKWIYLCYPCAAVCSGETILQTHISGKKHKIKIAMRNVWPLSLFDEHPFIQTERGTNKTEATEKVLQKMAQEVDMHNKNASEFDKKYGKYKDVTCHIQSIVDNVKAPLLGLEYLVEHPPEQAHYEPSYTCTLCSKHGHPRTIINHMTCFWHRYNYLVRHFGKACNLMTPYRAQHKYREGVSVIMNRLAQRIEDKHGRLRPVHVDKEEYENDKESIHQWIFKGFHFSENNGPTFEEVVDIDLINTLLKSDNDSKQALRAKDRDPSPPHVAAPSKPHFNAFSRSERRQERRGASLESVSDISDEQEPRRRPERPRARPDLPHDRERDRDSFRAKYEHQRARYEPYPDKRRTSPYRSRFAIRNIAEKPRPSEKRAPNYAYKLKLAEDKRIIAEESAHKTLAYHEKNPEKHPLYPEEWKKFWNRRYKEIQAEGKDPSKHDFKPEWIVFWTARMKELHDAELQVVVNEIYRKLCITPPDMRPRSAEPRAKSTERRRSPEPRRRSPPRRRSRSPEPRRREPHFEPRRKSPPARRVSPEPRPHRRARSPARTNFTLESVRRSRSPLSRREADLRNRSPAPAPASAHHPHHAAPSLQTVTISDDELKIDDNISPWNSDDMDSIGSVPEARSPGVRSARAGSVASRGSRARRGCGGGPPAPAATPHDLGPPENVVVTLRLLVALEDYLGSLGPKIVDLLTEAIRMEKEAANSSEELLERESAVVLVETAKEKLKGAVQAGLVGSAAAGAVRAAIVRAAATLHVADTRARAATKSAKSGSSSGQPASAAGVAVAGVGSVDRAQIAQQMAAALVAQGKTDVSSEELAQLVDAVVGIAEEKKRQEQSKKRMEQTVTIAPTNKSVSGTASALQMLQSAYDENDKKTEKADAPDAMDGLSDSDLETLLKNFNELSAEEQHSLIAYLKKLEAREPQRVERLRQYVSAAASPGAAAPAPADEAPAAPVPAAAAPAPAGPAAPARPAAATDKPIAVDSDDDDYTVEEVFKSVTEKVKEDQIRQEMEIVKKSLEETKAVTVAAEVGRSPPSDVSKTMSSAANLLALVQASMQSSATATSAVAPPSAVVASTLQPRSFGDMPIPPASVHAEQTNKLPPQNIPMGQMPITTLSIPPSAQPDGYNNLQQHGSFNNHQHSSPAGPMHDRLNFGENTPSNINVWEQRPMHNMPDVRGSTHRPPGYNNYGQNNSFNQQGPRNNYMNGRMQDNYDTRQNEMNQQFERNQYEPNNYGRGRGGGGGRGHFGGPKRGRGRGFY